MANATHHALVIGASGLIGWSVANQLLAPYPLPSPYSKVTKLVNRPLKLPVWPEAALGRPNLALFTGVDLLCSDEELVAMFKERLRMLKASLMCITVVCFLHILVIIRSLPRKQHSKSMRIRRKKSRSTLG
jgi:hypothetical protein